MVKLVALLLLVCGALYPVKGASFGGRQIASVSLRGVVLSATDGKPIEGVKALISRGPSVLTDGSGHFVLSGLNPGTVMVTLTKPGYVVRRTRYTLPAGGESRDIELRLLQVGIHLRTSS